MTTTLAPDRTTRSRQIAGYLGPIVIVLALSEAKNLAIWDAGNPPLTYQAGLLWFMGGLAVVRLHNRWTAGWPLTITLVGWFFLAGGLFRLFFPEAQQGNGNTPAIGVYVLDMLLIGAGALMSFKAYSSAKDRPLRAVDRDAARGVDRRGNASNTDHDRP
jgi:hypothetical protein